MSSERGQHDAGMGGGGRVRFQIDTGAIDAVGPTDIERAFETKETEMSKSCRGNVAANGRSIKNYGEKKIVG